MVTAVRRRHPPSSITGPRPLPAELGPAWRGGQVHGAGARAEGYNNARTGDKRSAFPVEYGDNVEGTGFSRSELDPPGQRLENLTALARPVCSRRTCWPRPRWWGGAGWRRTGTYPGPGARGPWGSCTGTLTAALDASAAMRAPFSSPYGPCPPSAHMHPGIRSGNPNLFFFSGGWYATRSAHRTPSRCTRLSP